MAITTAMCTSFRSELMTATHDFTITTGHAFKLGLFKATVGRTYGKATTNLSEIQAATSDEASGTGYTAAGAALTNVSPTSASDVAFADFSNDVVWTITGSMSSDGAFIHNTSASNATVSVHDFGSTKTATDGTFTVQMPAAASGTAILRLA